MKWQKKGLIYCPDGKFPWAKHSALQPTPLLISQDMIRVYVGFRDIDGIGRVGFVDVKSDNPICVLAVSERPVLDIGLPGAFDENGVIPCAVIKREDKIYLYYAGYQLGHKVRFTVFGGLAISSDAGTSFKRYSMVPLTDRTDGELYFRVIHSIMYEDGKWKAWYGGGSEYIQARDKALPRYNIRYMESKDGLNFPESGTVALDIKNNEYRLGRPYVTKEGALYKMFYGRGSEAEPYKMGYAESQDGINWQRKDEQAGLGVSGHGWDSQMIAYPSVISHKGNTYMFYNGNDYGKTGFGYAILDDKNG